MKSLLKFTFLICFIAGSLCVQAQQYRLKHYGALEGFTSRGADNAAQDSAGFIWFGTNMGLFRFDGVNTLHWKISDPSAQKDPIKINFISIDRFDRIWISCVNKLLILDPISRKTRIIKKFINSKNEIIEAHPDGVATDQNNRCFVTTDMGLFSCIPTDSVLKEVVFTDEEAPNFMRHCIGNSIDGTIYFSFGGTLYCKKSQDKVISVFYDLSEHQVKDVSTLTVGKKTVWCGNYDRSVLMGVDLITKEYREIAIAEDKSDEDPSSQIMAIAEINDSIIWTGSYVGFGTEKNAGGVSIINLNTQQIERIYADNIANPDGLRNAYLDCIFKDSQGTIWLIGIDGVDYYHPTFSVFTIYSPSTEPSNFSIPTSGVCDVDADDQGNIWVATKSGGLVRIDRSGHAVDRIPVENTHLDQSGFIFGVITCGRNGKLYIAATSTIYEVDTRLPNAFNRTHRIVKSNVKAVTRMLVDNLNNLWIATHFDGLYKIHPDGKEEHFSEDGDDFHRIPEGGVLGLSIEYDTVFACIGNEGVYTFVNGKAPVDTYSAKTLSKSGWTKAKVREVELNKDWVLFSTKDKGVQYLNRHTGAVSTLNEENGLPQNTVCGIEIDKNGIFWIADVVGLTKFNPITKFAEVFTAKRTLPETGFFNGTHDANMDGMIFFGNHGHLIGINPDKLDVGQIPLHPCVLSVKANGREIWNGRKLPDFAYYENNIQIDFSSQNFVNPGDDKFYYKLEGFSSKWIPVETGRTLIFTNLAGGNYTLNIKVENAGSNAALIVLPFFVKTAFYKTWWFMVLVMIFVLIVLYIAYKFRIKQLLKVQQLRNEISNDLHDDIGSTLSSVYYSAELLRQQGEQHPELKQKIASNISENTRDLMERMRDIVWSIQSYQEPLPEMISRMREYVNKLDINGSIQFEFDCKIDDVKGLQIDMRTRRNLYLIFKEAVNNAIKYSKGNLIVIAINANSKNLFLSIKDNGIGFNVADSTSGNGLRTMKLRVEESGGVLNILNSNPGTIVAVEIPLK